MLQQPEEPNTLPSSGPDTTPWSQGGAATTPTGKVVIDDEIRARIVAALSNLKGQRGSPFSFVTGDTSSFSFSNSVQDAAAQPDADPATSREPSLKLSNLLRPLQSNEAHQKSWAGNRGEVENGHATNPNARLPSYISSISVGEVVHDPIRSGILDYKASTALFDHFVLGMNAKWEYLLDPRVETHDRVREKSDLLLTAILFCSSKFVRVIDGTAVAGTDFTLQSRLCSLARSLAIRALASGDRSVETMQAFYLLACWKDPEDDISYLHSGYALRVLNDFKFDQNYDGTEKARHRRTWLALFRQDRQQSLFFMRRAALGPANDEGVNFNMDLNTWLKTPHATPLDLISCCNADLRRIQAKMNLLVERASPSMLPCLADQLDSEFSHWKALWRHHLKQKPQTDYADAPNIQILHPGSQHTIRLAEIWEQSIRLNVSAAILRRALLAATMKQTSDTEVKQKTLRLDVPAVAKALSVDVPGLRGSIHGAFETLQQLVYLPKQDLRCAPDVVLLLGPNAALYLCLLLCLPSRGLLGPSFQEMAVTLVRNTTLHFRQAVKCPEDTINLHAAYLESLVRLLEPKSTSTETVHVPPPLGFVNPSGELSETLLGAPTTPFGDHNSTSDGMELYLDSTDTDPFDTIDQDLYMQSLANLLDPTLFIGMLPLPSDHEPAAE